MKLHHFCHNFVSHNLQGSVHMHEKWKIFTQHIQSKHS